MLKSDDLILQMNQRLLGAGEKVWQRYPHAWEAPTFKSAPIAAGRLLACFPQKEIMVMRNQSLRAVREAILDAGRTLVVPDRYADQVYTLAPSCISEDGVLRISPMPKEASAYSGPVGLLVVACTAFDTRQGCLYAFDPEHYAEAIERLTDDGCENGWHMPADIKTVAVAADCQEVNDWPDWARSYVKADIVVTPTRTVRMRP